MKKTALISLILVAVLSVLYRNFGQDRMGRSEEQIEQIMNVFYMDSKGDQSKLYNTLADDFE